jgi:hypothetical protein
MNQIIGFGMIMAIGIFIVLIMHANRGNPRPPEF